MSTTVPQGKENILNAQKRLVKNISKEECLGINKTLVKQTYTSRFKEEYLPNLNAQKILDKI